MSFDRPRLPDRPMAWLSLLVATMLCFTCDSSFAQCTNITPFATAVAPTSNTPFTISTCTFQTEYNTITGIVAGQTYFITSSCGGYVTVRRNTANGPVVVNGNAPLSFTAPTAGTYYIHYNTNAACGTASICCTTAIACTSCAAPVGCVNTIAFGTAAAPTTPAPVTISACNYQTEYSTVTGIVAGQTYTVGNSCGGYVTVRHTAYNGAVVVQGNAPLSFTAAVAGTYFIHYNTNSACGTASLCCTTTITCTSCTSTPPVGACTAINIPTLPVSGQALSCHASNLITAAYVAGLCGTASTLYLGGVEALYTVTPTTTGSYAINYAGQTWSSIWVFSGACPAAGGTCVGSVSSAAAAQSLVVTMTAGVQYWILFDTFPAPPSPCPGTFSINNVPPPVVASDCGMAVNVCTNINFQIDPNGFGAINEIPPLGSLSNPDLIPGGAFAAWGTDNWGCLRAGELNSTWMVVNVLTGGSLEFTFGGLGTQTGFYDWIMYPFSTTACTSVAANTLAPVRCNWNGVSTGGTGLAATLPAGGNAQNFEPPLVVGSYTQYLICFSNWSSVTTAVPLVFGGTAVVSCSPLPVQWLSFTADLDGADAVLRWITATEQNSLYFAVERAGDAEDWKTVGTLEASGQSNAPAEYTFIDPGIPLGTTYYRLRQVDVDGAVSYSTVQTLRRWDDAPLCHPNPTSGAFIVQYVPDGVMPEVLDANGRTMAVDAQRGHAGQMSIRLLDAAPGVYAVRVGEEATTKLLVVEQ